MQLKVSSKNLHAALKASFDAKTIFKGKNYQETGMVQQYAIINDHTFYADVAGSQGKDYEVGIKIENNLELYSIDADCSCPVGYNCKHAAAAVLEILLQHGPFSVLDLQKENKKKEEGKDIRLDYQTESWVKQLLETANPPVEKEKTIERLVFIFDLNASPYGPKDIGVTVKKAKILKNGSLGKLSNFVLSKSNLDTADRELYSRLIMFVGVYALHDSTLYFQNRELNSVLEDLIKTRRCYWKDVQSTPLSLGEPKTAHFSWELSESGLQSVQCDLLKKDIFLLPLEPLWYVDAKKNLIGPVHSEVPPKVVHKLLHAPALNPYFAKKVVEILSEQNKSAALPLPKSFQAVEHAALQPVPCITLYCATLKDSLKPFHSKESNEKEYALGRVLFRYGTTLIPYDEDHHKAVASLQNDVLVLSKRDPAKETVYWKELEKRSLNFVIKKEILFRLNYQVPHIKHSFLIGSADDPEKILHFMEEKLSPLKAKGWEIIFDESYPFRTLKEAEEWYGGISETEMHEWFNLELGVIVEGKRIDLLPSLLKLIHHNELLHPGAKIDMDKKFVVDIGEGCFVSIPYTRLQPVLQVLREIYTVKDFNPDAAITLSREQAALLAEIEKAFGASQLRWFGERSVLELGKKLESFSGITSVAIPKDFQATLRSYQHEGVNWLQFLREYNLNGILADDMGLGKTIQTLAHILIEKENGRLIDPVLIVAPTSVITNWKIEAERFTPKLRILLLQGQQRKDLFSDIKDHDLILTTYPLLVRDSEVLLDQAFSFIILDEAQYIKNTHAKVTQIVQQLNASHRLCLSGTPLENHLGELWSLFHFLMPGLLGSMSDFKQQYRFPIERNGDTDCQARLTHRVKPFILRRTKAEVIAELPEKIETVRYIELEGKQRDLYETIRLALHNKVKKAIDEQGIERSQIIILDALLKLRQVCCDPRLLKLEAAKEVHESAKLASLMEILPELLEEGRRILLFSQFTSMLELIEAELEKQKISFLKLTGQTKDRLSIVQAFQNLECPLFLISLKAGGTGLNLTAADTVIHYDPWWNPSVENQATDRAHRIGQNKSVFVYKFVATGTVEEKILAMQQKKKSLADAIFAEKADSNNMVTREDFEALFV